MMQQIFSDDRDPDMGAVDVGVTGDKDNVRLVPSKRFDFLGSIPILVEIGE